MIICYVYIVFYSRGIVICEFVNFLKCILIFLVVDGSGFVEIDMVIFFVMCYLIDFNK